MLHQSKDLVNESVKLISSFQSGKIKPVSTGIPHLDYNLLGGLLPGTVLSIVARSGHGKTYDYERIKKYILSTDEDVVFLDCNWEMSHFKLLTRDMSYELGQSIKDILFNSPDATTKAKLKEICESHRKENLYYQNEPVSPKEFEKDITELIEKYPDKKIIVSIDNLENTLRLGGSQKEDMDEILYKVNILKNKHPFISFIILNQMNRDYLSLVDNPKTQRPDERMIYGTDQLFKISDVVYFKIIPYKLGIGDKFMMCNRYQYPYLDDFKMFSNDISKTGQYDAYGNVFYVYSKIRQPESEEDIRDLFIENIYSRREELPMMDPNKVEWDIFDEE